MNEEEGLLVCKVGSMNHYGDESEWLAARLKNDDIIIVNGKEEKVAYTWFYDGINITLKSGAMICPSLGDKFYKPHLTT